MSERSTDLIERKVLESILEGVIQPGEALLSERDLATHYQVGRPTIREVLQRLERDGWIALRKGMPPIVNDYLSSGNLMTIVRMIQLYENIPHHFFQHMLELRISITPAYTKDAASTHRLKVISLLSNMDELGEDPKHFADYDWNLQRSLASLSPNPVYLLLLNSFNDVYPKMAETYFSEEIYRKLSRKYYEALLDSLFQNDLELTEKITREMMKSSLALWKEKTRGEKHEI
ncbi:GntR family transcriptional regulator [Bacillus spongiae]|uniref:GntR family transcriptional regulator n=1 Tax=Bacillus spongiae TaxID=2683610 RepID=A0ABU8HFH5_9BACI